MYYRNLKMYIFAYFNIYDMGRILESMACQSLMGSVFA